MLKISFFVCFSRETFRGEGGGGRGGRWRLRHVVLVVLLWMTLHRHGKARWFKLCLNGKIQDEWILLLFIH